MHELWRRHKFGFGPYATRPFQFSSLQNTISYLSASWDDFIRLGHAESNPWQHEEVRGLLKLIRRFIGNEPLHRVNILGVDEFKRVLKWLNINNPKQAIFAWHVTSQLQSGDRAATTTTRTWGDIRFCLEGLTLAMPPTKTAKVANGDRRGIRHPDGELRLRHQGVGFGRRGLRAEFARYASRPEARP